MVYLFCESKTTLSNLKNEFKIVEYNWPNLDLNENFNDPDKFLNLLYDKDLNLKRFSKIK